mgnify:CR=1 FL=1
MATHANSPRFDATVFFRLALSAGFLSAVADRFGLWGPAGAEGIAWGNWSAFVAYTGQLTGWLSTQAELTALAAIVATMLELVLGLLLLVGLKTRFAALLSGLLLLTFALSMTISASSLKPALDYSVYVASAGAFLLASLNRYPYSLDSFRQSLD